MNLEAVFPVNSGFSPLGIPWEVQWCKIIIVNLTKQQKSAITGMILGDAYLQPTGKKNARLRLEQKASHRDYLVWKTNLLKQFFQGNPTFLKRKHPKTNRTYEYVRQQSNSSPVLGRLRTIFYPNGKKRIPQIIEKFLCDDIAFAVWFYDDGYYYPRDKCSYIYLGRVSIEEAEYARDAIKNIFNIENRILDKRDKGFVLYFPRTENEKIRNIVEKYYVPVMAYKIPIVTP